MTPAELPLQGCRPRASEFCRQCWGGFHKYNHSGWSKALDVFLLSVRIEFPMPIALGLE